MVFSEKKRVLIIEDDEHIAEGLKLNLDIKGFCVRIAKSGEAALYDLKSWQPDLVVLDIMLPGMDGFSVLENIRLEDKRLPVLILSAMGETEDKIKGFSLGVDDYLSKPFSLEEFLLRVDRLLFRALPFAPDEIYTFGQNRIDFTTLTAIGPAGKIRLTEQEAKLLKLLITNRGKPLSRERLLETGLGYAPGTESRTIDNFMVRFRKYFEKNPKKPVYFRSLRSVGYIFDHKED